MDAQEYSTLMADVDAERPTGAWAGAPSLASSTVDMVNTSGWPVDVFIAGVGTSTVVKVDGATLDSTWFCFGGIPNQVDLQKPISTPCPQ